MDCAPVWCETDLTHRCSSQVDLTVVLEVDITLLNNTQYMVRTPPINLGRPLLAGSALWNGSPEGAALRGLQEQAEAGATAGVFAGATGGGVGPYMDVAGAGLTSPDAGAHKEVSGEPYIGPGEAALVCSRMWPAGAPYPGQAPPAPVPRVPPAGAAAPIPGTQHRLSPQQLERRRRQEAAQRQMQQERERLRQQHQDFASGARIFQPVQEPQQ